MFLDRINVIVHPGVNRIDLLANSFIEQRVSFAKYSLFPANRESEVLFSSLFSEGCYLILSVHVGEDLLSMFACLHVFQELLGRS